MVMLLMTVVVPALSSFVSRIGTLQVLGSVAMILMVTRAVVMMVRRTLSLYFILVRMFVTSVVLVLVSLTSASYGGHRYVLVC